MFKPGDVVFGSFATKDGAVLQHYSVVLRSTKEASVLVYTTSLKQQSAAQCVFTREDMALSGMPKPCRWDAARVSVVSNTELRYMDKEHHTVHPSTLTRIVQAHTRALANRTLEVAMLNEHGAVVC